MKLQFIKKWLGRRWKDYSPVHIGISIRNAYAVTFSGVYGELVLQHLVDSVYCTTYMGSDPILLAAHEGRRSVIQEILELLSEAENPPQLERVQDGMAPATS